MKQGICLLVYPGLTSLTTHSVPVARNAQTGTAHDKEVPTVHRDRSTLLHCSQLAAVSEHYTALQ